MSHWKGPPFDVMAPARCPDAIWLPGPGWKISGVLEATGVTLHSAEYDLDPDDKILFNALHSERKASWHFTITKDPFAFIFQHYEDVITWHCGPGNPYTIGIELEGVAPAIVEGPQYDLLVRLLKWIKEDRGWSRVWHRGRQTATAWMSSIYEHQDWMNTSCAVFSNNQIDPVKLIADLKEEDMAEIPTYEEHKKLERRVELLEEAARARAFHEKWLATMGTASESIRWEQYIDKVQAWRLKGNGWAPPA